MVKKKTTYGDMPHVALYSVIAAIVLYAGWAICVSIVSRAERAQDTYSDDIVVCAADAKQCPDGSYVSRTGPSCQFAACPTTR